MGKILFFGYGAYRSRNKVLRVLGKEPVGGRGAIVEGYELAIEPLELVPEGPRKILEQVWGKHFRSYSLKKGNGLVAGRIWEIDDDDMKLAEWEFVGVWRELIKIEVTLSDKTKVRAIADKIINTDPLIEIVDGLNYEDNLNAEKKEGNDNSEDDEYRVREIQRIKTELEKLAAETSTLKQTSKIN